MFNFNKPKVKEPCYVYWNGSEFKKGDTKGDDSFSRVSIAYYAVESVILAIPKPMYKALNIKSVKDGEDIIIEGDLKIFLDKQWANIGKLCKLENIMK